MSRAFLSRSLREHRLALALFPLLAAVFLYDVLFLDKSLSAFDIALRQSSWTSEIGYRAVHDLILSDSPYAHYPERQFNWRLMRAGQNAEFSPYIFSGMPVMPQGIGGFVTSLPQLFLSTPEAIDWSTWFRLTLAGFFMYLLLVGLGLERLVAVVGGIVWTYNLHQIVWLEFPQHLATQLWIPLLFLLNYLVLKQEFRREHVVGLFLVNLFFYTSGYTQIVLYTYIAIGLFNTVYVLFDAHRRFAARAKRWLLVNLLYVALAVVVLPGVLEEAREISDGLRGAQKFRLPQTPVDLGIGSLIELGRNLLPGIDGLKRFYSATYLGGAYGERWSATVFGNAVEGSAYFGVLSLFFAFFSLSDPIRRTEGRLYLALVIPLLFFLGLSVRDDLIVWIFGLIPLAGLGSTARSVTIIVFVLTVLAGFGLSRFAGLLRESRLLLPLGAILVFAAVPFVVKIFHPALASRHFLYPLALLALLAAATYIGVRLSRPRLVVSTVAVVTAADLALAGFAFNTRLDNELVFPTNETIRHLLSDEDVFRVAVLAEKPLYHPNMLSYYGLATIGGYSTVAPRRYLDFIRQAYGQVHVTVNGILFLFFGDLDVLRLLNVKYVISDRELRSAAVELDHEANGHFIYRIVSPLARAYCASHALVEASDEALLERFTSLASDFDRPVATVTPTGLEGALTRNCAIRDLDVFTNRLKMVASADEQTLIFVPYGFSERWRLEIDGRPSELMRANYNFMAFKLPPGEHAVEVYYRNDTLIAAAVLQIALAVAVILIVTLGGSHRPARYLFVILALVIAARSAFSIPGVRNDSVPERFVCHDSPWSRCRP